MAINSSRMEVNTGSSNNVVLAGTIGDFLIFFLFHCYFFLFFYHFIGRMSLRVKATFVR